MNGLKTYRKPGETAFCENCGVALCIHLKRFCGEECKHTWFAKQPDILHVCGICGARFIGKPWRKRCDACWKREQKAGAQ